MEEKYFDVKYRENGIFLDIQFRVREKHVYKCHEQENVGCEIMFRYESGLKSKNQTKKHAIQILKTQDWVWPKDRLHNNTVKNKNVTKYLKEKLQHPLISRSTHLERHILLLKKKTS